jgi:UDP-N-acetylmuramate dehydrogenase
MGVGGPAALLAWPGNREELLSLLALVKTRKIPWFILGNGTNVIFRDGGFPGIVICLTRLSGWEILSSQGKQVQLRAQGGVSLRLLVDMACRQAWAGLEFAAGIPGSVGGALMMNAGAFGREMKDVTGSLEVVSGEGHICRLARDEVTFSYRRLALVPDGLILSADLVLAKGTREIIEADVQRHQNWRRTRHPLSQRSAGSIFKNPPGNPAGEIIDRLGLKGLTSGDAQVSRLHGNFIVNLGQAEAQDIISLITLIKDTVQSQMGIDLEEEVKIVGVDKT